jgi:hypothetical protein
MHKAGTFKKEKVLCACYTCGSTEQGTTGLNKLPKFGNIIQVSKVGFLL